MALKKSIIYKLSTLEYDIYNNLSKKMSNSTIDIDNCININDCYCRIEEIKGNKDILEFRLCIYNQNQSQIIESKMYSFIPSVDDSSENFIKQSYEYLKTLEDFKNAVDC